MVNMPNSCDPGQLTGDACFLWVNLTPLACTPLGESVNGGFKVHCVRDVAQIPAAIALYAPTFLCFEFDEPNEPGMSAVAQTRCNHPDLPVLMITGGHSEAVALWALRIRLWDLLFKPVSAYELSQCLIALFDLTRRHGPRPAREIRFPTQNGDAPGASHGSYRLGRTYPAVSHVAANFDRKIALRYAANLCHLSPTQFCRVFRQEQGTSFGQHLLRYRIEQACERLADPGALAKEVAYAVGFNDLSYFTRAFKRQVGVCPSQYHSVTRRGHDCLNG
jgi:two-component system, response regulator YesN